MFDDPIVAEIRKVREAYAESMGCDLARIVADLKSRQGQDGRRVVDRTTPRQPNPSAVSQSSVTSGPESASSVGE